MPINVPLPQGTPMDAFMEGASSAQGIFQSMQQSRESRQRIAESQQKVSQNEKLFPHLIQKYIDAEQLAPIERDQVRANIRNIISETNARPSEISLRQAQVKNYESEANQRTQQQALTNKIFGLGGQSTPPQNPNASAATANTQLPGTPADNPPENGLSTQNPSVLAPPQTGQEEVVTPARKGEELKDLAPGATLSGIKIPDLVRSPVKNGFIYTTWPSGKTTRQKVAPTDEESERTKSDVKESAELEKAGAPLVDAANTIIKMDDLLDKDKDLTGWGSALSRKVHASGKGNTGEFVKNLGDLVQSYVALEKARPGIGMSNWAERVKPDIAENHEYNKGMMKAHAEKIKEKYDQAKEMWESKNPGKTYGIKLPERLEQIAGGKMVSVRDNHTGKITKMTESEANKLIHGE